MLAKSVTMFRTSCLLASLVPVSLAQEIIFEWNYLNFSWQSANVYEQAVSDKSYIPENNIISGIKVNRDRVYLTLPRWKNGVPATLVSIARTTEQKTPLLEPYPNWDMQKLDDCSALQYVQSMEIDPASRMWILENGRTEFLSDNPRSKCPARLIILDLLNDGQVLLDYQFPADVARRDSVILDDIVLDHEDGGWAYITDFDAEYPGIIVFSLRNRTSWKVTHPRSMRSSDEAREFRVEGTTFQLDGAVDGIALSPASASGDRTLYYSPLSSFELFSLPVSALRSRHLAGEIDEYVETVGKKSSQTDGMQISATGVLYYGQLGESAVDQYDTLAAPSSFADDRRVFYRSSELNQWPDSFSMCDKGWLWWTSNRKQNFLGGNVDLDSPNYRVIAKEASGKSYQYFEDGTHPELPTIADE
ncbi:protein yellow-like [Phymastichus coffea]|uniref:protein yellow-like n=1 Tax=Phymastichus coffea TaxID=108790 RepID=UPI00273C66BC|nr:protein yellow-like [Phymastichus coffea]